MRYPAFAAEMGLEHNRPRLWFGVWSGYGLAAAFAGLATGSQALGIIPPSPAFHALWIAKLVTNTIALLALRRNVAALELSGLNVLADIAVMTGAIYLTGGQASPLFAIYVIEISVIALLTNVGVTVAVAAIVTVAFGTMSVLVHAGVLPQHPSPLLAHALPTRLVVVALTFQLFVLVLPTTYTGAILRSLRQKERALEARTAELIEAGTQKSQFMANVTHELRTPIHGIASVAELVESGVYGPVTDRQTEACRTIQASAQSLQKLVDDLLLLARSEAGKLAFDAAPVAPAELVESVVASTHWMLGKKAVKLDVVVEPDLPHLVTDRGKLAQVLVNLLGNAVKFTPEGGRVTLDVRRAPPEALRFSVRDTGIGIEPADLERIFEPFRQLEGGDERRFGGVGLGLSVVRQLSLLLGGRVEVESAPGKGSTFTLTLPLRRAEPGPDGA
ncbi:MAG: HAMP domain-containing histidine kinase [Polyangiaceae bacterium]|nr:HAMP domain-containing histidine kinase [Polyangiaceae bacterium]